VTGGTGSGSPDGLGDVRATSAIGWGRAVISAVVILVVGLVLLVYLPNWVLENLTGVGRHGRVAVTTAGFFALFFGFAWVLRRLQAHGVI
jgi:hypothetical protein